MCLYKGFSQFCRDNHLLKCPPNNVIDHMSHSRMRKLSGRAKRDVCCFGDGSGVPSLVLLSFNLGMWYSEVCGSWLPLLFVCFHFSQTGTVTFFSSELICFLTVALLRVLTLGTEMVIRTYKSLIICIYWSFCYCRQYTQLVSGAKRANRGCRRRECHTKMGLRSGWFVVSLGKMAPDSWWQRNRNSKASFSKQPCHIWWV